MASASLFAGILGTSNLQNTATSAVPVGAIPAGFDAIAQFNMELLGSACINSLHSRNVDTLAVTVPYQSSLVPASVQAAVNALFRFTADIRPLFLQLRLSGPSLVSLRSGLTLPEVPIGAATPVSTTAGSAAGAVGGAAGGSGNPASLIKAQINWNLELVFAEPAQVFSQGNTSSAAAPLGPNLTSTTGSSSIPQLGPGATLASATAATAAYGVIGTNRDLLQAWVELDFANGVPLIVSATDPTLTDLLAGDFGKNLLLQAVMPLQSRPDLRLSPTLRIAGDLNVRHVQHLGFPNFDVRPVLLLDAAGKDILSLCVSIGKNIEGADSLVAPFLTPYQFGYYVSDRVMAPVLKLWWALASPAMETVETVPVTDPNHPDAPASALVHFKLSPTLADVQVRASGTPSGDALRLVSEAESQALQIITSNKTYSGSDLGSLGNPTSQPLIIDFYHFNSSVDPGTITPAGAAAVFLARLLGPFMMPLLDPLPVRSVGGFVSSPIGALVIRWSAPTSIQAIEVPPMNLTSTAA